jgi:hypothetical protein
LLAVALLGACSPRNPLGWLGNDDDSASVPPTCDVADNSWPAVLPEYLEYEGNGVNQGDYLHNFNLRDQHGKDTCLSQFLGNVLIVDASTRWCQPCN